MNVYVYAICNDDEVEIKSIVANSYHDAQIKIMEDSGYSDEDLEEGIMDWDEFLELEYNRGNFYSVIYDKDEIDLIG